MVMHRKKLPEGTRVEVINSRRYQGKYGWISTNTRTDLKATHYAVNLHPANLPSGTIVFIGRHQVEEVPVE